MDLQRNSASYSISRRSYKKFRDVTIKEGDFVVKNIVDPEDFEKSFRLRHLVFAEELKWVPKTATGLETDNYDNNAVAFGVLDKTRNLSAYMRLIMAGTPFMMEKEFSILVGAEHKIRKGADTAEVSRLCVAPAARNDVVSGNFGLHGASLILLKGVYQWCLKNRVNYLYAVTEEKIYRLYRAKGFPFKLIGEPRRMADGVIVAALIMDWTEFEELNRLKRPMMFNWFCQDQSSSISPRSSAMAVA